MDKQAKGVMLLIGSVACCKKRKIMANKNVSVVQKV